MSSETCTSITEDLINSNYTEGSNVSADPNQLHLPASCIRVQALSPTSAAASFHTKIITPVFLYGTRLIKIRSSVRPLQICNTKCARFTGHCSPNPENILNKGAAAVVKKDEFPIVLRKRLADLCHTSPQQKLPRHGFGFRLSSSEQAVFADPDLQIPSNPSMP